MNFSYSNKEMNFLSERDKVLGEYIRKRVK